MDYTELVKKLRYESTWRDDYPEDKDMLLQAADAIEKLQATLKMMEDALTTDMVMGEDGSTRIRIVPKWIPVTEKLPEPGVPCLCWCKGGTYGQIRWYGLYYLTNHRTWAFYDNDCIDNKEVTHWMYRPGPPKEDEA